MCERKWIYYTLMTVAGFFGAYTYLLRGNVFCNAQTGNVVLMGMALGAGKWEEGFYYLIPITAYLMGAFLSELVPNPVKHHLPVRWDTLLIGIEMLAVACLGFVPESAPVPRRSHGFSSPRCRSFRSPGAYRRSWRGSPLSDHAPCRIPAAAPRTPRAPNNR